MKNKSGNASHLLLISILCLLVYLNSFHTSLHYDDFFAIMGNTAVREIARPIESFRLFPSRFLLIYSFAVNFHFSQMDPFGYHVLNFFFHLANAILVYLIARKLFESASETDEAGRKTASLFIALVFASHPIMTESVTYISGRTSSMAAVFFLLAFLLYILAFPDVGQNDQAPVKRPRRPLYMLALLVFFVSLWVKESNITLPVILLLFDFYFVERGHWGRAKHSFLRQLPFGAFIVAVLLWRKMYLGAVGEPFFIRSVTSNVLTQFRVIVSYLRMIFLPIGQNIDYDFPLSHSPLEPATGAAFILLLLLTVTALLLFKRDRLVSFGILWFLITLTPTSSFIPLWDIISERWVYLPAVGILFAIGSWLARLRKAAELSKKPKIRKMFAAALTLSVFLLSTLTIARNSVWKTEYTLWKDAARKSPDKARPHINLGMALAERGDLERAMNELGTAISIDPDDPEANFSLAYLYLQTGRYNEAIRLLNHTLAQFPSDSEIPGRLADDFAMAHFNLGVAYFHTGDYRKAIREYERALSLAPYLQWTHSNMGVAYEMLGEYERAIEEYEKELELNPGAEQVLRNIEVARAKLMIQKRQNDFSR